MTLNPSQFSPFLSPKRSKPHGPPKIYINPKTLHRANPKRPEVTEAQLKGLIGMVQVGPKKKRESTAQLQVFSHKPLASLWKVALRSLTPLNLTARKPT